MKKSNLICWGILLLSTWGVVTANAQTKIWGAGSGVNEAEAEFSTAFTQASTAGNYTPTAWTALHVSQASGSPAAYWTRSLLGYSQGAYAGTNPTPMPSPSQSNGIAIFDSDLLDNNGVAGAFGSGVSPSPHRGELISPRIDLTGYTNTPLVVQFYSQYREYDLNQLSVGISTDDGVTWDDVDYRALQSGSTPAFTRVLFNSATNGVTNLTQCRLRFVFDGDYYYAMLDDISIEVAPNYDIAMGLPNPAGNLLIDAGDFAKVGSHAYIDLENIDATDLREWFWGGKVVNYGAVDLLPTANPRMYVSIDHDNLNGTVTNNVYLDTIQLDTARANSPAGATYLEFFDDLNWISLNGTGRYEVTYWLEHDSTDGNPINDTVRHSFSVTDGYQSKARLANSDGKVYASQAIFPSGGPFAQCEYGSVFYFPRGTADGICLDSLDFRYRLAGGFTGAATQTLFSKVYELDASQGVLNNGSLLTEVGLAQIPLSGLGTTVTAGDYGLATATAFFDPSSGTKMGAFKDNSFYYISILMNPGLTGGVGSFTINDVPMWGADGYNYFMNMAMTRADSVINPSPLSVTDASGNTNWYWTGFVSPLVPSIGLYLSSAADKLTSTTTVWETEGAALNIYPNPAQDVLTVALDLDEADDVTYIITDMTGRVVFLLNSSNVTEEQRSMDISNLASGSYMLTAKTSKGTSTERFVKQ